GGGIPIPEGGCCYYEKILQNLAHQTQVIHISESATEASFRAYCRVVLPFWWPDWLSGKSASPTRKPGEPLLLVWRLLKEQPSQALAKQALKEVRHARTHTHTYTLQALVKSLPRTLPFMSLRVLLQGMKERAPAEYAANWTMGE